MKERQTWAMFRHIPNNEEGIEFIRMFKKYRNKEVIPSYKRRYRKPANGKYSISGDANKHTALEFSLYVMGYSNPLLNFKQKENVIQYWKKEAEHQYHRAEEEYQNRYEISIFQLIQYKIKQFFKKEPYL